MAPRTWHIEATAHGDWLVVNQFGGFEGRHKTLDGANMALAAYAARGDAVALP